jgi:hypothetical protein
METLTEGRADVTKRVPCAETGGDPSPPESAVPNPTLPTEWLILSLSGFHEDFVDCDTYVHRDIVKRPILLSDWKSS